jgi:hypothetical protein
MSNADPNQPVDKILKDIEEAAREASQRSANFTGAVQVPFAGLLVNLSRHAAKATRRMIVLTWVIAVLTAVLTVSTCVLIYIELAK